MLIISMILVVLLARLNPYIQRYLFPPAGDPANHLLNMLAVREHLCSKLPIADKLAPILLWTDSHAYPPLAYIFIGAASAISGTLSIDSIASLQAFWLIITGLASYSLCRSLFDTKAHPKLGSLIAICSLPAIIFQPSLTSHLITFNLDLPSTATVMLFLAAAARASEMNSPARAAAAGASLGIALLVKWTAAIYLIPALLYLICRTFSKFHLLSALQCFSAALLPAMLTVSYWMYIKANHIPVISLETGWLETKIAWYIFLLNAGISFLCFFSLKLIKSIKKRSLALLILTALFIAMPFYFFNFDKIIERADHHASDDIREYYFAERGLTSCLYPNFASPLHAYAWFAILPGAIWLLCKGPKGSFMLTSVPLCLATLIIYYALGLKSWRYLLPGLPLQIIIASAWLMHYKWTKYPAIIAIAAIGLSYMSNWAALMPPGGEREGLSLSDLGTGSKSYIASLETISEKASSIITDKPSSLWFIDGTKKISYTTFQAAAFISGNDLCVRSWRSDREAYKSMPISRITKQELFHSPGPGQGTVSHAGRRILLAHYPDWDWHDLENICEADLKSQKNPWILIIGYPSLKEIKQYLSKPITVGYLGEQPARLYKCDTKVMNEGAKHESNR